MKKENTDNKVIKKKKVTTEKEVEIKEIKDNNIDNKKKVIKKKRKKKNKFKFEIKTWMIVVLIILDMGAIFCLGLAYGPYKGFREYIITTAMATMNHKYVARFLYSEETINEVLKNNTIVEVDENTNTDAITIGQYKSDSFESVYDEQVLKKDEGNDLYKTFKFKEGGSTFYVTAIYDPSKIDLVSSQRPGVIGQTIKTITKNNKGIIGINASGFEDSGGMGNGSRATGTVIQNGKITWKGRPNRWGGGLIGFNKDHKLVLTKESPAKAIKNGMMDAITFGPFLIVNGKEAKIKGNGGSGYQPRTIIAQRQDGVVLFFVIDGNGNKTGFRGGVSFNKMIEVLKRYKAYNAANLDGGASSILIINNKIINNPVGYDATGERFHPNAWIVRK